MKLYFISLFPEALKNIFEKGIFARALKKGLFSASFIDLRNFSESPHYKVDDYPYSHKTGMLLKADILGKAISSIEGYEGYRILYTCPKGKSFKQEKASLLAKEKGLIFICGYYEGVDERIFDLFEIERVSLGDFVLSSGELPVLTIAEATIRLIPGVIGKKESLQEDSIISGLLEHPQYTNPRQVCGKEVPELLLSGNHPKIAKWKRAMALKETLFNKPSMLKKAKLSQEDRKIIQSIMMNELL